MTIASDLRDKAGRYRELVQHFSDERTTAALIRLAAEYDITAGRLEAEDVADK